MENKPIQANLKIDARLKFKISNYIFVLSVEMKTSGLLQS